MTVIELKGSPKENGQYVGKKYRKEIHALAEIRKYLLRAFLRKVPEDKIQLLAKTQISKLQTTLPEIYEEFEAIAKAAEIDPIELAVLNNYTDMRDFYADKNAKGVDTGKDGDGGCSVFSLIDKENALCGQTWDMHASARPFMLHMKINTPSRPAAHILTVNGCVGLSGINEMGVCVFINNLHCSETGDGIMWPALVRGMLWQESAAQAVDFLKSHMPASGHNYMICDSHQSFNVETTGLRYEITAELTRSKTGHVVHTNHYLGSLKNVEISSRLSATTHARFDTLEKYFTKESPKTLDTILDDIFSRKKISNIDYDPPKDKPHASATCGGILIDLKNKKGMTYKGAYSEGNRFDFNL